MKIHPNLLKRVSLLEALFSSGVSIVENAEISQKFDHILMERPQKPHKTKKNLIKIENFFE